MGRVLHILKLLVFCKANLGVLHFKKLLKFQAYGEKLLVSPSSVFQLTFKDRESMNNFKGSTGCGSLKLLKLAI